MGKFRSKLKGQTKGKRWPKGQSSSSNPETHKYRDLAKSRFFQENLGSSGLTVQALKVHDNVQSFSKNDSKKEDSIKMDEEETASTQYSFDSMDSFASAWSGCSNMSFNRFLNVFRADSALHKEMLAVLAAVKDVIVENGGTETPTEYFCTLITTLEEVYKAKEEFQITAVLSLLSMGIKTVPDAVLKTQFSNVSDKMLIILKDYVVSENNTIMKTIFTIMGHILKVQEAAAWNHHTFQIFNAIIDPFCIHSKPKWRKGAQHAVIVVVKAGGFKDVVPNLAAAEVAKFCERTLDAALGKSDDNTVLVSSLQSGQTTILHTLGLMKEVICNFPKKYIKSSCEIILKLMTLNYPIVTSCGLQVLHSLFSAQTAVVPAILNGQLIGALYDYQPGSSDVQPTQAWLAVMQQAHVHLADVDLAMACAALPRIFVTATQLWLAEKPEVLTSATHMIEVLLKDAVTPACATKELVEQHKSKLAKIFNTVESCLSYQYHNVWHQVLHVIATMFEVGGIHCKEFFLNTLKTLSELRDSYKFSYNNELEHAVGAAVRSIGPEPVLDVIPLKKETGDLNIDRSWMLPVLKENIKHSSLDYFVKNILSLALFSQKRSIQLAEANDGIGAHSAELLYLQLWNLLPCFCNNPSDIKENFKTIAKVLGTAISDRKELRLPVMASLRKLIIFAKNNENKDDLNELARFDKNYLPILFNVYTTKSIGTDEDGQRLAALETIKLYLTIAKPELTEQLFTHALERLNSSSDDPEDPFIKESILDLIRALVPYQSVENISTLYNQCVKILPEIKNRKEQKKAYRILEEICGSESENCKIFIKDNRKEVQRLLKASMDSAAISSKGARLRCFHYLLKAQPKLDHDSKLIKSMIPEVVLACKDLNEKCRATAYDVLQTIGERLIYQNHVQEFMAMLVAGLAGTIQLISCTVLAFASVLHNFSGSIGQENIQQLLENVSTLMMSPTREIVASCLAFLKVYLKSLPSPLVAASLPVVMKSLSGMTEDCKRHFRLKIRDILDRMVRKYGAETISPHIPPDDTVMYKRLRNLRKLNSRKKKRKETSKDEESDDDEQFIVNSKPKSVEEILADSDSDFEDMEIEDTKERKTKKIETWIEEDPETIVDFTDPTVASKVTATKPGQKQLPMLENEKKTDKIKFDKSDSDDDSVETLPLTNRKRKRSATSSVKSGISTASSKASTKYKTGGIGIHRSVDTVSVKSGASGSEYRSKKSKGDVKKKGKFDPYAYLPLQRTTLNKRKKMKSTSQFKNIMKAAKRGALKGAKSKRKNK
ncbi:hypothetical protein HHI36_007002 [Cryptolaemus montrouzieri]|uniref:RRP12-like protein n=1 Tax=Cryptolaemus montrouzieri TaxID=559131 RepID=A0ABD2MND7_9CUCU